jgi:Zn-dependent protease with chaperone function
LIAYGGILALSLVWCLLSGVFGARLLRKLAKRLSPATQLWLWFGGLYALLFSALTSTICLGVLIWYGWTISPEIDHGPGNLWYLFIISVLPYIALALVGAALAAVFTKLQPAIEAASKTNEYLKLSSGEHTEFGGIRVRVLESDILAAALVDVEHRPLILVTRGVLKSLNEHELEAVYWHELGHGIGEHNGLTRIARFASVLVPWLPLAREAGGAVSAICERLADQYAATHVGAEALESAHAKFTF